MHTSILFLQLSLAFIIATIPSFRDFGDEIYIGVDNIVHVDLNDCDPDDVDLKISSGTLIKRSDSTYSIVVQIPDDEVKIKLYYKRVVCQIKTVNTARMPNPGLGFEFVQGKISKAEADKAGKLILKYPEKYANITRHNIISFNITIIDPTGRAVFSTYTRGDTLDNNTLNMLKKVQQGAKLQINNVVSQSPNLGTMHIQASLELVIME